MIRCFSFLALISIAGILSAAEPYTGPIPPKPDIPYLKHADHLVETEVVQASEDRGKHSSTYKIEGAASPARTPLAEPIFIMRSSRINPQNMELYQLEVKGDHREIKLGGRHGRPLRLTVTPLGNGLYRIEADEPLENGEYSLSPSDSNQAFCFQIY
jgi:hypothetical protein